MTIITAEARASMHARRLEGESFEAIAKSYGLKETAVYQSLRRAYGLEIYRQRPEAANDNHAGRVVRMSPHNGGCSTLSGPMPVTLVRIPTIDGVGVGDGGQMQVAA